MGKDCDLCLTNGCLNRITWSIRYFIYLGDKNYVCSDDECMLNKVLVFPEGICIDCFFVLKNQWFKEITQFEIIPTEEFISEIKLVVPDFEYEKITWDAIYSSSRISNEISFDILNEYEHNYSKYYIFSDDRYSAIDDMIYNKINISE